MTHSPFPIRGVIEAFYGVYYTAPERDDLISFIAEHGFNHYIYGPKNDRQHRARWREPYPDYIMEQFAKTVSHAKKCGVDFCYSIGCGVSINYASETDFAHITSKFKAFYDIGVRKFMIMLDDISAEFHHAEDRARYTSYAEAHVDLTNKLYHWLKSVDAGCELSMCPTDYHGQAPFSPYLHELGEGLHPAIDIYYTGPDICSRTISEKDSTDFAAAVNRKPVIWDNYPVNDLEMTGEMHIGPIYGRDASLPKASKGLFVNTMSQAEASKVVLVTYSDYFADPVNYNPWKSWDKAIRVVGGDENYESLRRFAEISLQSCLGCDNAQTLNQLTKNALDAIDAKEQVSTSPAVQLLHEYLDSLDEAGYILKFRMRNYALRNNLIPWIELMESWAWAGRRAIAVLKAVENNEDITVPFNWLNESAKEVKLHPKTIAGDILMPLIKFAKSKAEAVKGSIV
ncbi:protein O-GlcNAcase [Fictibacillus terranigra]|uniref:Protein O-GlcNAcase n=1 Tax=Fictibacillus terranigra TaxID=3058424 RepID=A0ABT8EBL9_9BACL|nr:protein O-GlcNAcase [Fictibacillus sp. CENA-BCM004]MDN4075316.1 protein O-GlcNAcase [Fictibacillus sp. CENA-BCM004]